MKTLLLFFLLAIIGFTGLMGFVSFQRPSKFYYAFEENLPLAVAENKAIICYAQPVNRTQAASTIRKVAKDDTFE